MARGTAIGMFCRNLPRPSGFDASPSANRVVRPVPTAHARGSTKVRIVPGPSQGIASGSLLRGCVQGASVGTVGAHLPMTHPFVHRAWRLAVTLGPLVAIALTLVAGRRW